MQFALVSRIGKIAVAALLSALLAGCGKGGVSDQPLVDGSGPAPTRPPILALTANPSNLVVSSTSGSATTLTAEVVDSSTHLPMRGVAVTFSSSTGTLSRSTASTDNSGVATDLLTVASGSPSSAGSATALSHGVSTNVSIQIANLASIMLSAAPATLLCQNGNAAVSVVKALALDSSNNPVPNVTIAFSSDGGSVAPLATTDATGQAPSTVTAPMGMPDGKITITAHAAGIVVALALPVSGCNPPPSTPTTSATPSPSPSPGSVAGAASALQFISATPLQLGVLGSSLPQQSTIIFKVTDAQNRPVPGVVVEFFISSIGGEAVSPPSVASAMDGTAQTVLTSGRRATVTQVSASTGALAATSTAITILGGLPVQGRVSASSAFQNIAGSVTAGLKDPITVLLADRFSNPVSPGTAVNLSSFGGTVQGPSASDNNGIATGALIAESPTNPSDLAGHPTGGIATVLAFARGETPFFDFNGNGIRDPGEPVVAVPEPFFDLNGNGVRDPNEPFIDVNGNGVYDTDQSGGQFSQNVIVFTSIRVTFSGASKISVSPPAGFVIPNNGSQDFTLTLADSFGNPLVGGTTYQITSSPAGSVQGASGTVPDGQTFGQPVDGLSVFTFTVNDSDSVNSAKPITLTVTVTSPPSSIAPGGNGNTSMQISGTMD